MMMTISTTDLDAAVGLTLVRKKVPGAHHESGKRAGSGVQGDKGQGLGGAQSTALPCQYFR